jgi:hypothetical protein
MTYGYSVMGDSMNLFVFLLGKNSIIFLLLNMEKSINLTKYETLAVLIIGVYGKSRVI